LAIIQSYASALRKEELLQSKKQEYINTIIDASRRLSGLVTNVLRLNKLENQEIITAEPYSLDEQLRCCILGLEDLLEEKDIEVEANLDEVNILSDENLLEIVWNNLITNALKFTEPHGRIAIELKEDELNAIVTIKDNGCGMDQETCKRIFDRFYQGDTSHSTNGNGLGLSMVKRVMDMIDGDITVQSEPGKGSVFEVIIEKRYIT
jgi:signal transduction histidine kinase